MKILVAYDGTLHSQSALRYGIKKASAEKDEIRVLLIFNPGLFIDYEAGPKALDIARREFLQYAEDARKIAHDLGSEERTSIITLEGDPVEEIIRHAKSFLPDLVLVPPRYKALMKKSPAPVQVIPGVILVPVDNTSSAFLSVENIISEAISTGSKVLLLGVVPVHLFNKSETSMLDKIKKETVVSLKNIKRALEERGLRTEEAMRHGYPDEEIIKVAEERAASLIILPSGSAAPSELNKAAAIILEESGRVRMPVFLVPAEAGA